MRVYGFIQIYCDLKFTEHRGRNPRFSKIQKPYMHMFMCMCVPRGMWSGSAAIG